MENTVARAASLVRAGDVVLIGQVKYLVIANVSTSALYVDLGCIPLAGQTEVAPTVAKVKRTEMVDVCGPFLDEARKSTLFSAAMAGFAATAKLGLTDVRQAAELVGDVLIDRFGATKDEAVVAMKMGLAIGSTTLLERARKAG